MYWKVVCLSFIQKQPNMLWQPVHIIDTRSCLTNTILLTSALEFFFLAYQFFDIYYKSQRCAKIWWLKKISDSGEIQ